MADELLKIRLEELRDDVTTVGKMLGKAARRGEQLTRVSALVAVSGEGTIGDSLNSVRSCIDDLSEYLGDADDDDLAAILDDLRESFNEVSNRVGGAAKAARALSRRMRDLNNAIEDEDGINKALDHCVDMTSKISAALNELDSNTDGDTAWGAFDALLAEVEPLFSDYVDFLSGVTLRDYKLDDGVGGVADQLFKELRVGGIAVPARQGETPTTLTALARFQFPEWTLWDVPLAGYHAGLSRSRDFGSGIIADFRARHPSLFRSDDFSRQLFAEVYATCVVGPAYAYAALLLHLHPRKTLRTGQCPSATDRAVVILATLHHYAQDDPRFGDVVTRLDEWWSFAAGGATLPAAEATVLTEFADRLISERLSNRMTPGPYLPTQWHDATRDLRNADDVKATHPRHAQLIDRLNAFWHLRLTDPGAVTELIAEDLLSGKGSPNSQYRGRSAAPRTTSGSGRSR